MDYKSTNPSIGSTTQTETRATAAGTAPNHPITDYVQGQIAGQQGTEGITQDMQGMQTGLQGQPIGGQHIDYSGDPFFIQITNQLGTWSKNAGMVPEQFAGLLAQCAAAWCSMNGGTGGSAIGYSFMHYFTTWMQQYGATGGTGIAAGTFGQSPQALETTGASYTASGSGPAG